MGWFGNTPIFWKHPYTSHLPKRNSTMEVPHLSKHIGTTCDLQDWFFSNRTSLVGGWITHLKHMRTSNWIISPGRGEQITRFETTTTTLLKYTSPAPRNCSRWTGKNTTKKNNTVFLFTWNGKKHTHTPQKKTELWPFFCVFDMFLPFYYLSMFRVFGGCVSYSEDNIILRVSEHRHGGSATPPGKNSRSQRFHKKKHTCSFCGNTISLFRLMTYISYWWRL